MTIQDRYFHVTIICPRCDSSEHVHYLMALRAGDVWTGAPPVRIGKHHAQRIAVEEWGLEAGGLWFGDRAEGLMPPSEVVGRNQSIRIACDRCKQEHLVQLETLRLGAHMAWKNQWDRLTFDENDALVKFDRRGSFVRTAIR